MWPRPILPPEQTNVVCDALQKLLADLIDLGLVAKQAHWNVYGNDFLAVHEKLDEVVETSRNFGDLVAERIVKLGRAADGRVNTVAAGTSIPEFPAGFHNVEDVLAATSDRMKVVVDSVREAQAAVSEVDPMTEDLCIEIGREMETHFWMLQAMEGKPSSD